jgi:hypothetical protein
MQSSATCQASRFGDWAKEDKLLEASVFGFRGWQVNPNLIFGDGEIRLRPQMEVWFCAIAGTYAARLSFAITPSARNKLTSKRMKANNRDTCQPFFCL